MITNEERREIAARLRECNLFTMAEIFGFNWEDDSKWRWHDVGAKIADLIEPQELKCETCEQMGNPDSFITHLLGVERHRYVELTKTEDDEFGIYDYLSCGHVATRQCIELPNYCPYCGCRIIKEQ